MLEAKEKAERTNQVRCEYCTAQEFGPATIVCGHIGAITGQKRLYALCAPHAEVLRKGLNADNLATYKQRAFPRGINAESISSAMLFQANFADPAMFDPEHDQSGDWLNDFQ